MLRVEVLVHDPLISRLTCVRGESLTIYLHVSLRPLRGPGSYSTMLTGPGWHTERRQMHLAEQHVWPSKTGGRM